MRARHDVDALQNKGQRVKRGGKNKNKKAVLRTSRPPPRTRMLRELPRALKCTPAPYARIRARANRMYVQMERERAHASKELSAPATRTAEHAIRARTTEHRECRLFPLFFFFAT